MGRTAINFACAHSGANGTELTGEIVGHGRKSVEANYCLRRITPLWRLMIHLVCILSFGPPCLFFGNSAGGSIAQIRPKRCG